MTYKYAVGIILLLILCEGIVAQNTMSSNDFSPFFLASHFSHPHNVQWKNHEYKSHVELNSLYYYNANTLPLSVNNDLLLQETLTNKGKNDALANRGKKNLFEGDFRVNLSYSHQLDTTSFMGDAIVYGGLRHRNMTFIRINKDAMDLLLLGNGHFEDDTAKLSSVHFKRYTYHSLDLGVRKRWQKNDHQFEFALGGSFLQGSVNWDVKVDSASIYTAPDGEYIDVDLQYEIRQANQGAPAIFALNGIGVSCDASLIYTYQDRLRVRLSARDVGYIEWQNETNYYKEDTSLVFSGVNVPDIVKGENQFGDNLADSLVNEFDPFVDNRSYQTQLPATFEASVAGTFLEGSLTVMPGFRYRLLPGYQPHFFLKGSYYLPGAWGFSLYGSYGGYGSYNAGLEVAKRFGPFDATIGSYSLQGFVAPESASGASLFMSLGYSF